MKTFLMRLRNTLRSFHREQAGTALTEFVITLPVYLIFFSGIITLHQLQEVRLYSHQSTSAELWSKTIDAQTSYFSLGFTPAVGAGNSLAYYRRAGDFWTVANALDTVDAAGGLYVDSGFKTKAVDVVPLLGANIKPTPQLKLQPNVLNGNSHAFCLMNDTLLNTCAGGGGGGVAGMISAVLDVSGARPSIAAGIRYGVVGAVDKTSYDVPLFDNTKPKARYNVSAPTYSNERWESLALTRLEMSRGHKGYDELLEFGILFGSEWGGPPRVKAPGQESGECNQGSGGGLSPEDEQMCEEKGDEYISCMEDCESAVIPSLCRSFCSKPPKKCREGSGPADGFGDIDFGNAGEGSC